MKKLQLWIAFVIPLLLYSCINDPGLEHEPAPPPTDKLLTVDEARAYFEQQITHETRSGHARSTFLPENFTPEWNDAIQAENGKVTRVDVPIRSNTRLRALRSEYTDCAAQPYIVDVAVKLVVLQKFGLKSHLSQYLMLLVPDRAYYANHKNGMDEIVPESDDMKNYSGYAIYYQLYSDKPSYISKYSKGGIVEHLGLTDKQEGYDERIRRMHTLLSQIRLVRSSCVQTRMDGEIDDVIIYGCGNCCSDPCICDILNSCPNCGCNPCQCHDNNMCSACMSDPCQCYNNNACPYCGNDYCGGSCVGGSSGGGGNNSGSGNDNSSDNNSGNNDKTSTTTIQNIKVTGTNDEIQFIRACLNKISKTSLGEKILNFLSTKNISIKCVSSIPDFPNAGGLSSSDGKIQMTMGPDGFLFEELFHQYQYNTPPTNWPKGNREFEAKCVNAMAANENLYFGGIDYSAFKMYLRSPNSETLQSAIDALRGMGYNSTQYPITIYQDMIPHLNKLKDK